VGWEDRLRKPGDIWGRPRRRGLLLWLLLYTTTNPPSKGSLLLKVLVGDISGNPSVGR